MKKLLVGFLILVISSPVTAAIPITYDGKRGVFIEGGKANNLLSKIEIYIPRLEKENELLKKEIRAYEELEKVLKDKVKTEQEITIKCQENYESAIKKLSRYQAKDDLRFYIYAGLFVAGTIVGGAVIYGSSLLIKNIR